MIDDEAAAEEVVRHVVRRITGMLAPARREMARPEDDLRDDLEYDSLRLIELAFALEDAFALEQITREEGREIRTVGHIEAHIFRATEERNFVFEDGDPSPALRMVDEVQSWSE